MVDPQPVPSPAPRSRGTRIYLIVAAILFGLPLLPAGFGVLMTPMAL